MRILQLEEKSFLDHFLFQLVSQMFSLLQLLPFLGRYLLRKEARPGSGVNNWIDKIIITTSLRLNVEGAEKQWERLLKYNKHM